MTRRNFPAIALAIMVALVVAVGVARGCRTEGRTGFSLPALEVARA